MHVPEIFESGRMLLVSLPLWATATLLYFLTISILFIGRHAFEGLEYNVSWASQQGDVALIGCILIGATILRAGTEVPEVSLVTILTTVLAGGLFFVVSLCILSGKLKSEWTDAYHHAIVVPLFIWLLGTTLPVIYVGGSTLEKDATLTFLLSWAVFFAYDVKTKRLNQREYLVSRIWK